MKIKEIILEGFKSYRGRIALEEVDQQFNCITGMNGSGKSNILDAICFVLGLQSFSLARASNIQDLVYKGGQSGVKEASVMVSFDNTDKSKSPEGYAEHDTINVCRKIQRNGTKFYINGVGITNINVKRMFKSIGLNIDNPETFFVQQGKITRIVSFRPTDLLEMLEESAGIGYYKEVSKGCKEVTEDKYSKLTLNEERMHSVLGGKIKEIERKEERLQRHRENERRLVEQQALVQQLEVYQVRKAIYLGGRSLFEIKGHMQLMEEARKVKKEELEKLASTTSQTQNISSQIKQSDAEIKKFEEARLAMEKQVRDLGEQKQSVRDDKQNFERRLDQISKDLTDLELQKKSQEHELNEKGREVAEARRTFEDAQKILAEAKVYDEAVDLTTNQSELHTVERQLDTLRNEVRKKDREMEILRGDLEDLKRNQGTQPVFKEKLVEEIRELNCSIERGRQALQGNSALEQLRFLERKLKENEELERQHREYLKYQEINPDEFDVQYNSQRLPHFNKDHVYGFAYTLIDIPEALVQAIQIGSGGRLYNIVVENDEVSRNLLNGRCFHNKVTLLPLNKVRPKTIPDHKLRKAEAIAAKYNSKLWYPPRECKPTGSKFDKIADFVLGNYVVCERGDAANQIAFDRECDMIVVTLDGDMFEPSGVVGGGYNREDRLSPFKKWQKFISIREDMRAVRAERTKLKEKKAECEEEESRLRNTRDRLAEEEERLTKLKKKLRDLDEDNIGHQVSEKEMKLARIREWLVQHRDDLRRLESERQTLSSKDQQEMMMKRTKAEKLHELEGKREQKEKRFKQLQKEFLALQRDIEEVVADLKKKQDRRQDFKKNLESLESTSARLDVVIKEKGADLARVDDQIYEKKQGMQLLEDSDRLSREKRDKLQVEVKELDEKLAKVKLEYAKQDTTFGTSKIKLAELARLHPQLEHLPPFDEASFDQRLERVSLSEQARLLIELKEDLEESGKTIDLNANQIKENLLVQVKDLTNQRNILKDNKVQIDLNKRNLDSKSSDTLKDCFEKVNKNFGEIFRSFLKGADAKMSLILSEPDPTGRKLISGIEIKVSFNNVWKSSLSELSGGQRSLLALSYLLAMLKYKSSPFYILDEIDAAMDLSHTENIGRIISSHFPQSQFIVISLKEAMFSQARVLYRTSVSDGQSRIERYVQK